MYVSVRTHISGTTHLNFTEFSVLVAVARSFTAGVAICYVYFRFCGWRYVFLWRLDTTEAALLQCVYGL